MRKSMLARFLVAIAASVALPLAAAGPQLLTPVLEKSGKSATSVAKSGATAVRFNAAQALALRPGDEVQLSIPGASPQAYVLDLAKSHGNGITSWIGRHKEWGNTYRAIVTTGPTGSFGSLSTPQGEFRLVPGSGHDWLIDMEAEQPFIPAEVVRANDVRIPPAEAKRLADSLNLPETMIALPGINSVGMTKVAPTPQHIIDIMFVYTQQFGTNLGADLQTRFAFLIDRANTSYADSDVAITLRLVNTMQVTYNGSDSGDALSEITPGCGFCSPGFNAAAFGAIEAARTASGADIVSFFMDGANNSGNGIAWLGSASPNPNFMYNVTQGCVRGCESVWIHEVGHNMGNNHDIDTVKWQDGGTSNPNPAPSTAFSYGYAFCKSGALNCNPNLPGSCTNNPECSTNDGSNFRELMAYFFSTTNGNRQLYRFSNPLQNNCRAPGGGPGTPPADGVNRICGIAGVADTAQVMNNNRAALSAIKASTVGSTLQFTGTAVAAAEGTSANLSVSRTGSSTGAVSVAYTAVSASAISGSDFTATSGTLNWADGDTANKAIVVPITNDGQTEQSEVFTVVLSNPLPAGGATGAVLGGNSIASVLIPSAYPPGGVMPPELITPDGSSGAWTVVTDQAFEGAQSLGSAQVIAISQGQFVNSDLRFTGSFMAGTIAFAYRISGYQSGFSNFTFAIDGVTVLTEPGGESGWKIASFPITAGNHTLRWRFSNALNFPCTNVNPPAVGGVNCAGRAWIDAVSLPIGSSISMAAATHAQMEAIGFANVAVNRIGNADAAASVDYATSNGTALAGTHYTTTNGTLNWLAGDSDPKVIPVPIIDNFVANPARTFTVTLSNATNATLLAPTATVVTINDDENTLQFTAPTATVTEGVPSLSIMVSRSGVPNAPASVDWSTANGTAVAGSDFGVNGNPAAVSGTLTWNGGDNTAKSIVIPILDDGVIEGAKTFTVNLSNPTGMGTTLGASTTSTVTLNDDDAGVTFSQASYNVNEGGPNSTITVNRIGSTTNAIGVSWNTTGGTAIAGQDYGVLGNPAERTGTLSWAAGDASPKTFVAGPSFPALLNIINDTAFEATESFTITLANPTGGAGLGPQPTTTVNILDNESTIEFAATTLMVAEGGANGTLTLTRTGSIGTAAQVNFSTTAGTATATSDYTTTSGTVTWAAGDGSAKTITVGSTAAPAPHIPVINDAVIESPETFTVTLSLPGSGVIIGANSVATVTINSEDAGLSMATAALPVTESVGTVDVIVNRSGAATGAVSVNYTTVNGTALAGQHYTTTNGTLNWLAGDGTPKTITVPIIDNAVVNASRTFNVSLSGAVGATLGAPATTTVTIADDDNTLQFTAAAATVTENTPTLTLTVSRLGGAAAAAAVNWSTANGTAVSGSDFGINGNPAAVAGTLNWAAGDATSKTIVIPILNDAVIESAEAFSVTLSGPVGTGVSIGATPTVAVTLNDDDSGVSFATATYNVVESGPNITVTVNRTGNTAGAIGVTWTTANGTAVAGSDFGTNGNPAQRTGTLTWAAGDATAKSFTVGPTGVMPLINDTAIEANETFTIALSNPTGGAALGAIALTTVTITDDESTFAFSTPTLTVGETGANGVLMVTRTGSTATAANVNYTTTAGTAAATTDYTTTTGTLSWAAGDGAAKSIAVGPNTVAAPYIRVVNDTTIEGPETFTVTLVSPTGGGQLGAPAVATVTIDSEDAGLAMAAPSQSVAESAGTVDVIVNRAGAATGAVSVNYTTVNGTALAGQHYTTTAGTLNWIAGDGTPKTITVPITDNAAVNAARTFNVTISGPVGATLGTPATTTVTIADDDNTLQFTAATATVLEGTPTLTLTVSRLGGTAGTAAVNWSTANGTAVSGSDFGINGNPAAVAGTLNWAAGDATSKTIVIPILNDAVIESAEAFSVALSGPVGTGVSIGAVGSVAVTLNDDESSLNFAQAAYAVNESGPNITVTVTRSGAATGAATVTWTTANGTAVAGQDFGTNGNPAQRTGVLSWAAGDVNPKTFTVGNSFPTVPIINDTAIEGAEAFTIVLSNPTGGAMLGPTATTTVTINDDESTFAFSTPTLTVSEAGPNGVLTVTRTGSTATAATVNYTLAAGTATATTDFITTGGTLSWPAGDATPRNIAVGSVIVAAPYIRVVNDATIEGPETFTVTLVSPTGGGQLGAPVVATVTIDSEDAGLAMATATQSVNEAAGTVDVIVNRAGAATGAVSVNYTTTNGTALAGTHYTTTTGTLNWIAGDGTPKTITVPIADNALVNPARTFTVTLSGPVGASLGTPAATVVTIADDDNTVQFSTAAATVSEGTATLTLTVTRLGGTAAPASVNWATADGTAISGTDFGTLGVPAPVTGTLNWAAADSASKSVVIPILNDAIVEGAKNFTVNLSAPTGATVGTIAAVTVTLNDNDAGVVFSAPTYVVNENGASVTLSVNRIGPTTASGNVTWTTANVSATSGADFGLIGNAAPRTGTLTWGAGDSAAKTIVIPMLNDALAEGNETFTVTLSNPSASLVLGTPFVATVTIADDETPPESTLQFSAPKLVVDEGAGATAVLSVTRTGSGFTFPVTVNYVMAAGTALAGSDYTASSGVLSWASGDSTAKTITIPITNDAIAENPEQFTVTLTTVSPGAGLGTPAAATVLVMDDDEVFPPDGLIPAGWGVPVAATQGWHVSNDPGAFDGVFALKSDFIDDGETAQIETTSATYLAGNITFRVKISSELNFDFLRFYVDGVQVGQWTGTANTGWQVASFPITAGPHVFRWSYEKDNSGSIGLDAAYIDAVVLPPM